jgi:predicted metalloprotease
VKHLPLMLCMSLCLIAAVPTVAHGDDACSTGMTYQSELDMNNGWSVDYTQSISADVESVTAYWRQTYPELYGGVFPELCATIEYVVTDIPFAETCGLNQETAEANAFYCIPANVVMWDGPGFFHPVYDNFGDAATTYIIAHEYGHAAQFLSGNIPPGPRTVNIEIQADCLAGAYLGYAAAQGELTEDEAREVISIAIAVGQSRIGVRWSDRSHGTSAQRVAALSLGFESGATACLEPAQGSTPELPDRDDLEELQGRLPDLRNGDRVRPRR